jgi:DNA-binding response OmpR family regulator
MAAKKILLVDDNNHLRTMMSLLLKDDGYEVTEVAEGSETMMWVHEHTFDLILLDIMMPLLDGYTVLRYIRNTARNGQTPVVIVSARAQEADIEKGYELGADAYVTKPFEPDALLSTVRELVDKPRKPAG